MQCLCHSSYVLSRNISTQTVACNNNVALCCLSTDDLQNTVAFATNVSFFFQSPRRVHI